MNEKKNISDMAYFGGAPAFEEILHVGKPNFGNREKFLNRISDILDTRWFSNAGPMVSEFEEKVANLIGVKHCIAMSNGTVALEIAIRALELKGEVILPSFTFIACAHCLQWQEITPVFCDVGADHNLDPDSVESMITPRTTGIMGIHLWGRPCNINRLQEIADRNNLELFFDASHAFGNTSNGRKIGTFGSLEVFSFHATKQINTLEGGAIVTNDDKLAEKIRLMKNFGFGGYDEVIYIGTNGKMNEMSAAMGLTNLEDMDRFTRINKINYDLYRNELSGIPGLKMILFDENESNNYQYIVLEFDEEEAGISRDMIVDILWKENVRARRYFYPGCHNMEPYKSYFPHAGLLLKNTEEISRRVLCLPNGSTVAEDDVLQICSLIKFIIENSGKVNSN